MLTDPNPDGKRFFILHVKFILYPFQYSSTDNTTYRSPSPWTCSHVQDWSFSLWSNGKRLDKKVCYVRLWALHSISILLGPEAFIVVDALCSSFCTIMLVLLPFSLGNLNVPLTVVQTINSFAFYHITLRLGFIRLAKVWYLFYLRMTTSLSRLECWFFMPRTANVMARRLSFYSFCRPMCRTVNVIVIKPWYYQLAWNHVCNAYTTRTVKILKAACL